MRIWGICFPTCHCISTIQHLILATCLPSCTAPNEGSLQIFTSLPSSRFDSHLPFQSFRHFAQFSDRSKTQWEHPSETPAKPSKPARSAPSASAGSGGTKTATTKRSLPQPKGWGYSRGSAAGEMKYNATTFQGYV